MKRKIPFIAAGVAAFGLFLASAGFASAAEDDTFSPLNRDPASTRNTPVLQPDETMVPAQLIQSPLGAITGPTYEASFVGNNPAMTGPVIMADEDTPVYGPGWGTN